MAALRSRCGHYIFSLWFLRSIFLSLFLAYSQPLQIGCLPYLHTWCGLSANLGCRSETCCMRLTENTGRKKSPKIRHLSTIAELCRAISTQLRHLSTIGKKLVKQQYLPHMFLQYGELGPLAAYIGSLVWGTPANFNGFRVLAVKLCGVEQRAPPIFGRAAIALGIGPLVFAVLTV